jgi:hypothetical protein
MRVTFIGHASILVESKGISILSDPWWKGPCFGAQWWLYPEPFVQPVEKRPIDYLYISHGHHDHFHPGTLKLFSRTTKVLIPQGSDLVNSIKTLGFEVIEIPHEAEYELTREVKCRILSTYGDDSLMAISDGVETCVNINDALHAAPVFVQQKFTELITSLYSSIDYVFCGYGTASHFPNCYVVPGKDYHESAARRQRYFNAVWARIVHELNPKFGFPFAADVVLLDNNLFWSNQAVHNSERPIDAFVRRCPGSSTRVIDIAPGFAIEAGRIVSNELRGVFSEDRIRCRYEDSIRRVNHYKPPDNASIQTIALLLRENIARSREYLKIFHRDYRFLIRFPNASESIQITKTGSNLAVDVARQPIHSKLGYNLIYTTRASYLMKSLTSPYGHETLFVGSGGMFEYTDPAEIESNIHRELMFMMKRVEACPLYRSGTGGPVFRAKRLIKTLLGYADDDLYDLRTWTVFSSQSPQCNRIGA